MSSKKRKSNSVAKKAKRAKKLLDENGQESIEITHLNAELCAKALVLISRNKFVTILGPNGSGRTSLALEVGNTMKLSKSFLYVDEQLDSNSLFGSYKSSGIPGDFTWEETSFATNIQKPNSLIILKGFESAPSDLIVSILRLTEDGSHSLPGGKSIQMHESSRIVAIVSQTKDLSLPKPIFEYPFCIQTAEYGTEEIVRLISSKLQMSAESIEKYYEVFKNVNALISTLPPTERRLTVKDFFTACKRLCDEKLSPTKAFMALHETWILHLSKLDQQLEASNIVSNCFSLSSFDVNTIRNVRVVEVKEANDCVTIGRAKLGSRVENEPNQATSSCALTRDYRNLMERIAVCVEANEPVLLNGETGIGKTKVIQQLAQYVNAELSVINMSLDSDAADLIGGYKPASIHSIIRNFMDNFFTLLDDSAKHELLKSRLNELYESDQHAKLVNNVIEICLRAMKEKSRSGSYEQWGTVYARGQRIMDFMLNSNGGTPFSYVSGIISRAIREGNWLLIDEINMASIECLNSIASLLSEQESLSKSSGFRLFACMNPATDAGKRILPTFLRSKFTEFFVAETQEKSQICEIINFYTPNIHTKDQLAQFYLDLREKLPNKFSLRNLCRSLLLSKDDIFNDKVYSLYLALELAFSSGTDEHAKEVQALMKKHIGNKPALKSKSEKVKGQVLIEGVYFPCGPHKPVDNENFLRTNSVRANLQRIACATASGRFPVLLEGETSAGKTSMLTYLAEFTGHKLHRINNHEHTDVQEYLGSYVADENNKLVFRDGILLQAMQAGDWVILDELNLAPTEVLEALNRLLDDNREVYVPEKDQVIKAHPQFRLFATQNPIGRYSGRKRLSRAFLNRFVVLNIQQPPKNELVEIVCKRCRIQKSAADIMLAVMDKLKELRSNLNLFSSTDSFITLRDLFRWGNRYSNYADHSDWRQLIADQGYLLLAGRCRNSEDRLKIQQVIDGATKRKIDVDALFSLQSPYFPSIVRDKFNNHDVDQMNKHIILTLPMRQMIVQCSQAFNANEPVLFVGETGCGKTSVVYLLDKGGLESINCHERIDTSDFLGKIRPTNDGLFEWEDGVVVRAMKTGKLLLLDEISLAQDSVLERLNPLLETERRLLLTDSGASTESIVAKQGFQFIATMNPGGDHGKKELSKALRNRFTEIWSHFDFNEEDVLAIIQRRLRISSNAQLDESTIAMLAGFFTKFFGHFYKNFSHLFKTSFAVRDAIVIADMVCNLLIVGKLSVFDAVFNTVSATLFDALPLLPTRGFKVECNSIVSQCQEYFIELFNTFVQSPIENEAFTSDCSVKMEEEGVKIGKFFISNGSIDKKWPKNYCFESPTALLNVMRVARGFSSDKPIMLEGKPGAGKSSLVKAMAELTGNQLIRINLSEQTEVSDLFGADVPIMLPDGKTSFVWQDGPVLKAIKNGAWLLLDEMNLASQSILESLNSCFDFRNEIYIAELNRRFQISRGTCRFFACQNSAKEGGGRKSLPKSFLNRFTKIYVNPMSAEDMLAIVRQCLSNVDDDKTAEFYIQLHELSNNFISTSRGNSYSGAPFEYNLRDLLRLIDSLENLSLEVAYDLLYIQRLHKERDKEVLRNKVFMAALESNCSLPLPMIRSVDKETIDFGGSVQLKRFLEYSDSSNSCPRLLACQARLLQQLVACVNCDFLSLLIGPAYSGKRSIVELLARFANIPLKIMRMTSETDAQDLLGSYEQIFCGKRLVNFAVELKKLLQKCAKTMEDTILSAKLEALVQLRNPNDMRIMAQDVLKSVHDKDILEKAEILANCIAKETLHFEWIDSDFVKAYTSGEWLLIEDVNVCNSAVLDRLNNCLEKDGDLIITEKADGDFKTVKRHLRFRVFFTMCPDRGILSPAMRNRSVEIFMTESVMFSNSDKMRLIGTGFETELASSVGPQEIQTLDSFTTANLLKVCSFAPESRRKIFQLPEEFGVNCDFVGKPPIRDLLHSFQQSLTFPTVGSSVTGYLRSFYENAWMHFSKQNEVALTFFYSRIVSGMQKEKALLIALMDKSMDFNLFNACKQVCTMETQLDSTILGIESLSIGMSESGDGEFKRYLASHIWLCLRWIFQRIDASPNSCLTAVKRLLSESKINEPCVEIAAVQLHDRICEALQNSVNKFDSLIQRNEKGFFELVAEMFTFDKLLRSDWNENVGDVALLKIARQLDTLGLRELLPHKEMSFDLDAILKFSTISNRPSDWKQLCPLPENSVSIFNSKADLIVVENRLKAMEKSVVVSSESPEFIVNITEQIKSILSFIKQFSNFDYSLDPLSFPIKALSAFHYLNEQLRRQHAEISLLNTKIRFGNVELPLLSLNQLGIVNGPLQEFWRQMNYRQTLHDVPIGNLIHFSGKLQELNSFLWNISTLNGQIRQLLGNRISSVEEEIANFKFDDLWLGLERMKSHAPADAIDPVLSIFADCELNKASMTVLDSHYDVLENYARAIFGDSSDSIQMALNGPILPNHNEYILFIRERHTEALKLTEEHSKLGENCRPQNSQYQRLGHLICDFINNAQRFCSNFNSENLPDFIDKLNKHRCKLLNEFFHYPDVVLPYLFGTSELEYQLDERALKEAIQRQNLHCASFNVKPRNMTAFFSDFSSDFEFHLTDQSPLPEHVQYRLLMASIERLTPTDSANSAYKWLASRWLLWYEAHSAKRKELYEYRKTARLNRDELDEDVEMDENEMPDMEMIEIRRLLPDFSKISLDEIKETEQKSSALTESELLNTLFAFIESGQNLDSNFYSKMPAYSESAYLPAISYTSMFENLVPMSVETEQVFTVHHLIELKQLASKLESKNDDILDVYKYSDTASILECLEKISLLNAKITLHKEEFPENTILSELSQIIGLFLEIPCDNAQMYFASSLEKLLEKSELWERHIPRQYSLSAELTPLREMLLEWRKMEVRCWSYILNSVENQLTQNCLLTSWPLVESFTRQVEEDPSSYEKNLLAMLLQWLNDSSLFDLKSRLDACRLLTIVLKFTGNRLHLIPKIDSICRYFAQFLPRLNVRVKEERAEAEEKLENLVHIAKYTDLNIWSVKDSNQRVHNQLCQIIHKFKIGSNKPALTYLTDEVPSVPEMEVSSEVKINQKSMYSNILSKLNSNLSTLISADIIENLTVNAQDLWSLLKEDVDYAELERLQKEQGVTEEDEIKEALKKAYGSELFKRQRSFADLRKVASNYGINFRKGLLLVTEELNELSLTGTEKSGDKKLEQLIPSSICARNVAIKLLAELNLHDKPHLKAQLSAQDFSLLRGIVEFGLSFVVNTNNRLSSLENTHQSISDVKLYIQRLIDIQKNDGSVAYNHKLLCDELLSAFMDFAQMKHELGVIRQYLNTCPKEIDSEFGASISNENVKVAEGLCSKLVLLLSHTESKILKWIEKPDGKFWVWKKERIEQAYEFSTSDLKQCSDLIESLKSLIPNCFGSFLKSYAKFFGHINRMANESEIGLVHSPNEFDVDSVKLKIQTLYNSIEQNVDETVKPMERLRQVLMKLSSANLIELEQRLVSYVTELAGCSKLPTNVNELSSIVTAFADSLRIIQQRVTSFLESFIIFYLNFCSIIHHFVNKGLVNPIPTPDKEEGGEGKMTEGSGDATGMGEGTGEKDVSEQIEETGQLEDLQDQQNDQSEDANNKDAETPIEMEDDFAADLEGIDAEENDEKNDQDQPEEDGAEQADWDMGDLDQEEDEKQLDPKLWENQKEVPQTDQENQAANEDTGEMAAQEEEQIPEAELDEQPGEEKTGEDEVSDDASSEHLENVDEINLDDNMSDDENLEANDQQETVEETDDPEDDGIDQSEINNVEPVPEENDEKPQDNQKDAQKSDQGNEGTSDENGEMAAKSEEKNQENEEQQCVGDNGTSGIDDEQATDHENTVAFSERKNQTDEMLADANESMLVEPQDDDQDKEEGNRFSHINDEQMRASDRQVVQKSTVDQASASRDKLRHHEEKEDGQAPSEIVKPGERKMTEHKLNEPFIKTSLDFEFTRRAEETVSALKNSLENVETSGNLEARWSAISESIEVEAAELAEQLRMVISPSIASKLQGDYRIGKRLNMRKLIPYIASNFRKDRIWMKRTRLDKRNYQICLAIDDSTSMSDNLITEITCQSICLIDKAFQQLEIGQVSVVKFGSDVSLLRDFHETTSSDEFGVKLLDSLKFDQKKTDIVCLLDTMSQHFTEAQANSTQNQNQLLIIIGDGRFTSSIGSLLSSIGRLTESNITVLYVILDNPKSSVFSIKSYSAKDKKLVDYMSSFSFPNYTVVQSVASLPIAVSEAIRQYFDLLNL